jgi:hypothetical protein
MALGLNYESGSGADILPIIKYDARGGRFTRIDREAGTSEAVDITNNFEAVFDFENIETGNIAFTAQGPKFNVTKLGVADPRPPSEDFKPGFRLMVKLGSGCGGGEPREFASTAKSCIDGVNALHDDYMAGVTANPGKLPVVTLKSVRVKKTEGKNPTSNYVPVFEITRWVPRPPALVAAFRGPFEGQASSGPPSTGSNRAAPPPISGSDDDDAFG